MGHPIAAMRGRSLAPPEERLRSGCRRVVTSKIKIKSSGPECPFHADSLCRPLIT